MKPGKLYRLKGEGVFGSHLDNDTEWGPGITGSFEIKSETILLHIETETKTRTLEQKGEEDYFNTWWLDPSGKKIRIPVPIRCRNSYYNDWFKEIETK